jgi:hypothetical protein
VSALKRILPGLLALGVSGLAGSVMAFTPDRAAIFVEALRVNDCAMSIEEAPELLPPLGLEPAEVQDFVDVLFTAGLVSLSEDMQILSLAEPLCVADAEASQAMIEAAYDAPESALIPWVPEFTPEQGAAMIGVLRTNGCAMSDDMAGTLLPEAGIDPTLSRDIVAVMLDMEMAAISEDGTQLGLSEELCAADPSLDAETIDAARVAFIAGREAAQEQAGDAPQPAEVDQ